MSNEGSIRGASASGETRADPAHCLKGTRVPRLEAPLRPNADRGEPQPQGDPGPAGPRHDHRDDGHLRAPLPACGRPRPGSHRRDLRGGSDGTGTEPERPLIAPYQVRHLKGGEPACRPGSVRPLARVGGHPSGTAVAGSLVRSTREHRAGSPRSLAQVRAAYSGMGPLDLAPGGVYRAAAVTCGAGGLLHHRFTLTAGPRPKPGPGGGLFSVALSRGSPRVGVTDHPALWSPDLPHRTCPGATARPTHPCSGYANDIGPE